MAKPKDMEEAAALLRACVRLGFLVGGDADAVDMLLTERRALLNERLRLAESFDRLATAADAVLDLVETADLEGLEGEGDRIQALRDALND